MGFLSNYKGNTRFWLKSYLFIGALVLILAAVLYSNHVIRRMQEQSQATTRLFSRFIAEVVLQAGDTGKRSVLQDVLKEIQLPVILTDVEGRPIAWHRVDVPAPADEEFEALLSIDPANPPPGKIARLIKLAKKFDGQNDPIPVKAADGELVQGYIHFGSSKLQRELRLMPLIQVAVFLVFMAAGFQGFRYLKLSEQKSIYVGMAKETAHQLGTPLSALLGWSQLLRDRVAQRNLDGIGAALDDMDEDLSRLGKITERFSKIGSQPELKLIELTPILEKTVSYFHKRLPSLKAESVITLNVEETPPIRGNGELLEWVFENLLKNSIDALGEKGGRIEIVARWNEANGCADVTVRDTGRGIPASHRQRIFAPGFTTKKRGWGLGLALTKRIVEEYHNGSIRLVESQPGKGAVFLVRLPAA
ncbi:MAG: HAMP domain-containing histidine kinase [Chitinivibrionia bacterium]|nr:HAMP domain-containing histidine kinase [Chitinivibrionia bacterium]